MDYKFIVRTPLFAGLSEYEAEIMLKYLGASEREYSREGVIYYVGQKIRRLGLLLSGGVNVVRTDVWGNQNIIGHIMPGEVFAETYACIPGEAMQADVVAAVRSAVLFLDIERVMAKDVPAEARPEHVIRNLLTILASKNLYLTQKMNHITPKTIRERILSYLSQEAVRQGRRNITIPFNRQQLADYLSVDRSALSGELSKMQKEGLLLFKKNQFELLGDAASPPS